MTDITPSANPGGRLVLQAIDLGRRFRDGPREICPFAHLNLSVRAGESLAVVGPSGVGKSTLLHLLGGLDRPSEGQVRINDQDVFQMSDADRTRMRNQSVGFVYQFHHLLAECSALENVAMPLRIRGLAGKEAEQQASALLEKVGLSHRLKHKPSELSGGERQRVAIARALVTKPALVLADEPTGNLDQHTAEAIYQLLRQLNRDFKTSFVVVTHDRQLASRLDQQYLMTDGKLEPL